MIRKTIGALAAGLCLMACGSNQPPLAERNRGEAESLQQFCKRAAVADADTHRADSLLSASNRHLKDGDKEPALADAELAGTLYRLALSRRTLADVQSDVEAAKQALAKDKDQLQTYQQILEEMKTVRKP
jgi:hypothetical protein